MLWLQPLYVFITLVRRLAYRWGLASSWRAPVPVLVVGNISVGGTGKTPLTIALVQQAQVMGLRVAVVSRGYGRDSKGAMQVAAESTAEQVGDEPLLIFRRTQAPVAVAETRSAAAKYLLAEQSLDLLITDDGLQHYALARDAECVVVDGSRGFGNGWRLPSGPLREPMSRVLDADAIVVNYRNQAAEASTKAFSALSSDLMLPEGFLQSRMHLSGDVAINLATGVSQPLRSFQGQAVNALAGIGNPEAFYRALSEHGIDLERLAFPDHHAYQAEDLPADGRPIIMTEKDAVKIAPFANDNCWYVPVEAELAEGFAQRLIEQAISNFKRPH